MFYSYICKRKYLKMMMRRFSVLCACAAVLMAVSCRNRSYTYTLYDIIPAPAEVTAERGCHTLTERCGVGYPAGDDTLASGASVIAETLSRATGLKLEAHEGFDDGGINLYRLAEYEEELPYYISHDSSATRREAYAIRIDNNGINIYADDYPGTFYALQTIMQMLPAECYSPSGGGRELYTLPACVIADRPAFGWRGMHMDVARHFFPKEFVMKFIDIMAMHKMNVLHWHLTDDQGWRIEIKKYPLLTDIGSSRGDSTDRRFYTQEEARQIVAYAAERGITVVPEIDLPGHSWAAIASYPELGCAKKSQKVMTTGGYEGADGRIGSSTLCAGDENTYRVYGDILDEIMEIFPSEYIHIGGDEADKSPWRSCPACLKRMSDEGLETPEQLQSYMIGRMERHISSHGRKLIGWDEIAEGGIAHGATVMSWRGTEGGIEAVRKGHDAIMTPNSHLYFDYYQDTPETEPAANGSMIPLSKVWEFDPVPNELRADSLRSRILGAQANTWTEYIPTPEHFEYMIVPRIAALAEVVWCGPVRDSWHDFSRRLYTAQTERYDAMGINYHPGPGYVRFLPSFDERDSLYRMEMACDIYDAEIAYTLDGTDPDAGSERYRTPVVIKKPATVKAAVLRGDTVYSKLPSSMTVEMHKGTFGKIVYDSPYSDQYPGAGERTLCDGMTGTADFKDGFNQGIANRDLEVTFDLGTIQSFSEVTGSFLQNIGVWIYLPEALVVYTSDDGHDFRQAARTVNAFDRDSQIIRKRLTVKGDFRARYVKVVAVNPVTPKGLPGEGYKNWVFADEIFIR